MNSLPSVTGLVDIVVMCSLHIKNIGLKCPLEFHQGASSTDIGKKYCCTNTNKVISRASREPVDYALRVVSELLERPTRRAQTCSQATGSARSPPNLDINIAARDSLNSSFQVCDRPSVIFKALNQAMFLHQATVKRN